MSKGNPYGFWLLHFPSDMDGFRLLGFLVGLARDLGLCQPRPQPGPVSHDTTVQSGLAVTLNGSADAFGTNTYSSANVGILVVDRGLAQCASGSATFIAAAEVQRSQDRHSPRPPSSWISSALISPRFLKAMPVAAMIRKPWMWPRCSSLRLIFCSPGRPKDLVAAATTTYSMIPHRIAPPTSMYLTAISPSSR